ncbi:MAG: hypothetical protein P1U56_06220 [Saprospiraceae bacterium]|nr:hypothetical protein [Saprospiraceae bacterium]
MEWFEKEYKRRFENESTHEGIESNLLWDKIAESIPQKSPKKRIQSWKGLLFFGLFFMGATILFLNSPFPSSTSNPKQQANAEHQTPENLTSFNNVASDSPMTIADKKQENNRANNRSEAAQESKQEENKPDKKEIYSKDKRVSQSPQVKRIEKEGNVQSKRKLKESDERLPTEHINDSNEQKGNTNSNSSLSSSSSTTTTSSFNNKSIITKGTQKSLKKAIESDLDEKNGLEKTIESEEIDSRIRGLVDDIPMLNFIHTKELTHQEGISISPQTPRVDIIQHSSNPWTVQLNTGANFLDLRYQNVSSTEQFASDANAAIGALQIGNTTELLLDHQLNDSWSIASGVSWNAYEHKLHAVLTWDSTALDEFEKLRNAKYTRTVIHHNKLNTLTIPLQITYSTYLSRKWAMGTSFGGTYSLVRSQRGKILGSTNGFLLYSDSENRQFTDFISLRIQPMLRYIMNDHFALQLNAGVSFQKHGLANIQNLNQSSKIYSIGLGLRYTL